MLLTNRNNSKVDVNVESTRNSSLNLHLYLFTCTLEKICIHAYMHIMCIYINIEVMWAT